ncbi:MAG: CatB-related O-acetyltransferase [Aquihabitans sp.]
MTSSRRDALATRLLHAVGTTRRAVKRHMPSAAEVEPGVWIGHQVDGAHNVRFEGPNVVGRGTSFQGADIEIGRGTTVGLGCVFNGPLEIGRYCQFGSYTGVYGVDHPIDVAVPNVNRSFIGGKVGTLSTTERVTIGHGSWFGHGAVVLRGVTIGNGAVIGAGTVVTADVPPYCVVVGAPGREPRPRFDQDLVTALEQSRWWTWTEAELAAHQELFLTSFRDDPDRARRLLEDLTLREDHVVDSRPPVD